MKNAPSGTVILEEAPQDKPVIEQTPASFDTTQTEADAAALAAEEAAQQAQQAEHPAVIEKERYDNLEKKLSEQGAEVGQLRKTTQQLMEENQRLAAQAAELQTQNNIATSPNPDFEAQIMDIAAKVESGDLPLAEAMRQQAHIAQQQAAQQAEQQAGQLVSQKFAELEQQNIATQFRKDNPDFDEVVNSGALEPIKQSNPVHDNVSAYFAFKAAQAQQAAAETAKQGYEAGRTEQEKLESGKSVAAKTLSAPGQNAQQPAQQGPLTESQIQASMLNTLKKVRAAAG